MELRGRVQVACAKSWLFRETSLKTYRREKKIRKSGYGPKIVGATGTFVLIKLPHRNVTKLAREASQGKL